MANINIKKGSYTNKANLKENGDIGFAKYNNNTGTIIINDGGTLVNLMPAPGVANKPLVGQGDSSAPIYKTLPIAGGGTGTESITAGKVPFVLNNVFTTGKHSIDQNRLSINADLKDSIALYVNGSSSFSNDIIVGNLSTSKRGTVRHFRPTYNWEKSKSDGYLFDLGPRTAATMVMIHVLGNGYNGQQAPINSMYQFYNYPSSWDSSYLGILSASGRCYGYDTGSLYVYNRGDNLYAYLECKGSAQTISFSVYLNGSVITPSAYPILKQEIPTFLTEDADNVVEIVGRTFAKISEGGTGANSLTTNRLLFYDKTYDKIISSNNYISASQLAINATAMPANTTFNLYVNGSAKINNLIIPIKPLSWINGKDTANASIAVETKMSNGNYHSILGIKTNKEHTISLGGIHDEVGFFTYKSNRTANGTDYRLSIDAETGYVKLGGHSTFATLIGPSVAGTFKFPDIGGTFVTHATRGTAVGSATTAPVYIASTGRATAITSVDIAHGGTGATTAAAARTNLGITPANIGAAALDGNGKVLTSQLPSYVDDVIECATKNDFPTTGEPSKIYVDLSTNLAYRWGGTEYVEISQSLALGTTPQTAFQGDLGKIAYDYSQAIHAVGSYGICETAADVITKEIVIDENSAPFILQPGAMITIKFSSTNTAANPKFKIGHKKSDGTITYSEEKPVFYNTANLTTTNLDRAGYALRYIHYVYDGEKFIYKDWSYKMRVAPQEGFVYIQNHTAPDADNIISATFGSYKYTAHSYVTVNFKTDVPADTRLNINDTGAKYIYHQGGKIKDGVIHAGDIVTFSTFRNQYIVISIDKQAYRQLSTFTTDVDLTWYTIAESPIGAKIGSVMGTFEVRAEGEESSSVSTFIAGISNSNYPSITQTSHSQTGVKGIRQVRIVYSSDLEENQAYLQILSGPCEKNVTIKLTEGFGWTLVKTPYADVAEIEEDFSSQQIYLLNNSLVTDYIDTNGIRSDGGIETGAQASSALYGSVIFGQWDPDNDLVEFTCPTLFYDGLDVSGDVSLDAPLSIPNGGTGATSFTANKLLFSNGSSLTSSSHSVDSTRMAINGALREGISLYVDGNIALPVLSKSYSATTKEASSAAISFTSTLSADSYHPMIGVKTNGGHNVHYAGLKDNIGFYGFTASNTTNTPNWTFLLDAATGNLTTTGALNVSGAATVKTLTISDTSGIGHLNFSRTGAPNYVIAPDKIAFNIGSSLSLETCALVVASNYVVPGASKYSTLGTESNLWKGVYAANVRANSFDAKGLQENQIRVWHSESETDALYLFGNQDGRRGLFDMDIGSIISIGPDYVNFNSYRSAGSQWARGREVAPFRSTFVPDRTFNSWSAFFPIFSRKTKLGSWEAGCLMPGTNDYNANNTYNAGSQPSAEHNKLFYEAFHFVHTYDDTYTSNTHTVPLRIFGNGLVHAQKLGVTAAGGYGTGNPPTGTADDPLFVGQLYFKIIE